MCNFHPSYNVITSIMVCFNFKTLQQCIIYKSFSIIPAKIIIIIIHSTGGKIIITECLGQSLKAYSSVGRRGKVQLLSGGYNGVAAALQFRLLL